ncbi:GLUG motif-containing protein [Phascolarctobacterium sp.]
MKNRKMLLYKKIMVTVLSSGMLLLPNWSYALPQGGQIVGGSGTIGTPSGGELNITGNGGHMAIDWNSFNIGKGETVNFQQLQAVLNYVTGSQRSEIFGNLNGNGAHVFLLNPNGILFGESAQVNVGSLTASTRSLSEQARRGFNGELGVLENGDIAKIQADIVNLGTIAANAINFEGNNISIIKADTLQIQGGDLSKVSLKAKNNINIGYEGTDKTNTNALGQKASALGLQGSTLDGTAKAVNDCLLISTVDELQAIQNNLNGNYMLKGDINASTTKGWNSGAGFKPIGGDGNGFTGVFDGMDHAINDLYMNRPDATYIGLFGVIEKSGVVKNFQLSGELISNKTPPDGTKGRGSIAGENWGRIENVVNHASIQTTGFVGGIVGTNYGMLEGVTNKGDITGTAFVGGIAGYNSSKDGQNGQIKNARNEGKVEGSGGNIGGITGTNEANCSIENSTNSGWIKVTDDNASSGLGGISGSNEGTLDTVINEGRVEGWTYDDNKVGTSDVGGIAGKNSGEIRWATNTATANIRGDNTVGGIAGRNYGSIESSNNHGHVESKNNSVGGISGNSSGEINKVSNSGTITSKSTKAGGIVGENSGKVFNADNSGKIKAERNVGGIVGFNNNGTLDTVTNTGIIEGSMSDKKGYAGGIAGESSKGEIKNASNSGTVTGKSYIGGIVGYAYNGINIENVYNSRTITGNDCLGGIVGFLMGGKIINAYNIGDIKGDTEVVGGIVGYAYQNANTVTNVYNLGNLTCPEEVSDIIGYGTATVQNAYFLTADGYQKYDDNTVYTTLEEFNQAFADGLGEDDKNAWQTGQKQTAPYLQSFLETISGDVGNVEITVGSDYKAALLEKLQALGITVDPDKILGLENLAAGEYDLSELLYSTQDGYDLQLTGKLVLKAEPQPQPGPGTDSKYTAALTSIQKKAPNNWEQNVPDERRLRFEENRTIGLEKNTVKIEAVLWDEVNLEEEEPLNE